MNKTKRVGIAFAVHNRREITLKCLRSLARIDAENLDVHIVVVDDGSTDGTSEAIAEEFPQVEVVKGDGNLWYTEGTNVGVRAALKHDPDYVLMMNDDQVFDSKFLKYMVETAEKYPRTVVGSLLLLWDTPHKLFQVAPVWNTWLGDWQHWEQQTVWTVPAKPWNVDVIVGNCLLVPTEAIRRHGLMNSGRYVNFGDAEYTPRLKRNGWRLLIDPRARVFCQPNASVQRLTTMSLREKFDKLILNYGHSHNLRRRFYANWDSAPSKTKAVIGFVNFFIRIAERKIFGLPKNKKQEIPNAEFFADAVVKD